MFVMMDKMQAQNPGSRWLDLQREQVPKMWAMTPLSVKQVYKEHELAVKRTIQQQETKVKRTIQQQETLHLGREEGRRQQQRLQKEQKQKRSATRQSAEHSNKRQRANTAYVPPMLGAVLTPPTAVAPTPTSHAPQHAPQGDKQHAVVAAAAVAAAIVATATVISVPLTDHSMTTTAAAAAAATRAATTTIVFALREQEQSWERVWRAQQADIEHLESSVREQAVCTW
jgi:hypothetical protein